MAGAEEDRGGVGTLELLEAAKGLDELGGFFVEEVNNKPGGTYGGSKLLDPLVVGAGEALAQREGVVRVVFGAVQDGLRPVDVGTPSRAIGLDNLDGLCQGLLPADEGAVVLDPEIAL